MNHIAGRKLERARAADDFLDLTLRDAYKKFGTTHRPAYFLDVPHATLLDPAEIFLVSFRSISNSGQILTCRRIEAGAELFDDLAQVNWFIYNNLLIHNILQKP